jgi:hypothetical protein
MLRTSAGDCSNALSPMAIVTNPTTFSVTAVRIGNAQALPLTSLLIFLVPPNESCISRGRRVARGVPRPKGAPLQTT